MAFLDGQAGKVQIATSPAGTSFTILKVTNWKVTDKVATDEVTNTTSGGYGDFQGVVRYADADVTALWDSTTEPEVTAPAMKPGAYVRMQLMVDATAAASYDIPKALVESVDVTVDAKGVVKYQLKVKSCGAFTAV